MENVLIESSINLKLGTTGKQVLNISFNIVWLKHGHVKSAAKKSKKK